MTKKPKVLFWDIETSLMVIQRFHLYKGFAPQQNILEDWHIICAAYKWEGEKKIHGITGNEKKIVKELAKLVSSADILVHQNGDRFDLKRLRTRMVYYHMAPLPPFSSANVVDTYKVAKKYFDFSSNSLDYMGSFLGQGRKIHVDLDLWRRVYAKDKKAVKEMVIYNKQDISLLEKVYNRLKPYIYNHPNMNLFAREDIDVCANCQSDDIQKRGFAVTRTGRYQRYQCRSCGAWMQNNTSIRRVRIR